jgi:hypothetical protein
MIKGVTALLASIVPRPKTYHPPLHTVPEVSQIDDLTSDAADLGHPLAAAGRAPFAGQLDHLVDPNGAPACPASPGWSELRAGPGENLVPLVIEVSASVDVLEAREAGLLLAEAMAAMGCLMQVVRMDHRG